MENMVFSFLFLQFKSDASVLWASYSSSDEILAESPVWKEIKWSILRWREAADKGPTIYTHLSQITLDNRGEGLS